MLPTALGGGAAGGFPVSAAPAFACSPAWPASISLMRVLFFLYAYIARPLQVSLE